jgi:hypothetical protein
MTLDNLQFAPPDSTFVVPTPRKCYRHQWVYYSNDGREWAACARCNTVKNVTLSRRNRNNGKRGRSDELAVAKILGGRKVGPLGLPWDVEVSGYLRAQCKQLDRWPSLSKVIEWLDAIPVGAELRAVTLADTPGPGNRTRRLIVLDLESFASWHGGHYVLSELRAALREGEEDAK